MKAPIFQGAPVTAREMDLINAVMDGFAQALTFGVKVGYLSRYESLDITGRAGETTRRIMDGVEQASAPAPRLDEDDTAAVQ